MSGVNQRAILAFLLLHANEVVATSRLLRAIWGDRAPRTARKMLQNAVSELRKMLASAGEDALLLTHAPGYLLQVRPECLDLSRFRELAARGKAELADGDAGAAARTLRSALDLWRGGVLDDVTESGIDWPELKAVRAGRLAAYGDWFQAEFALGRHQQVLGELEMLVAEEPLCERLCGQLMLALHHTGKRGRALDVYQGTKAALAERLGVEPGSELQGLERTMRHHSPVLVSDAVVDTERKRISVVLVSAHRRAGAHDLATDLGALVRQEVERLGGIVWHGVGSSWWAVFGVPHARENDACHAVRAALEISCAAGEPQVAVESGEVLMTCLPGEAPVVAGPVFDHCRALLASVPPGSVVLGDGVRADTEHVVFSFEPVSPGRFAVVGELAPDTTTPFVGRDRELVLLRELFDNVHRHSRPHLMTVLGEPGVGKSRLVTEFSGLLGDDVQLLSGRGAAEILGAHPDFAALSRAVRRSFGVGQTSSWVLSHLRALCGQPGEATLVRDRYAAWLRFLEQSALDRPLVVVLEDIHEACDELLDAIAGVTWGVPLLIVATARPDLLRRRPDWGGGARSATTVTLDRLSTSAATQLLRALAVRHGLRRKPWQELLTRSAGNPLYLIEYMRTGADPAVIPPAVRNVIAAQLDALPPGVKAVLRDAAILDGLVTARAVAEISDQPSSQIDECLGYLERWEFLRRTPAVTPAYVFNHSLVREVALSQLPPSVLTSKRARSLPLASGPGAVGRHAGAATVSSLNWVRYSSA